MNTTENNKLIAEFMGYNVEGDYLTLPDMLESLDLEEEVHFHSSWDWLMPVVEKITQETKEFKEGHIDSCLHTPLASALIRFTDRELVYEEVVEFIKWHNENK